MIRQVRKWITRRRKRILTCFGVAALEMTDRTCGIIIVGDEILKGRVVDTNSSFLIKRLYNLGIEVLKVSIIPDDEDAIAEEVSLFAERFSIVITTGGIGPTHDDVTYAGIAKAFKEPLVFNEQIASWFALSGECPDIKNDSAIKMALVPQSATLLCSKKDGTSLSAMPIVCVKNIYVLPGIPNYMEHLFMGLEKTLKSDSERVFYNQCLYLNRDEMFILKPLNSAVEKFVDFVTFGSYPILDEADYCTKITLESTSRDKLWEAESYLVKSLPKNSVVKKDKQNADDIIKSVYEPSSFDCSENMLEKMKHSIKIIEECIKRYDFSEIFISFNGGKDCTALLHLVCAVFWHTYPEWRNRKLQALYVRFSDPFLEVEDFIAETLKIYNIDLKIIPGPIKSALSVLLEEKPHLKAVLMGTRKTDPRSDSINTFQMTDAGWPQVMRVCPILDWSYEDLWTFIRKLSVPYCCLYDKGYTSIGNRQNTTPNPRLKYTDKSGEVKYQPAYLLADEQSERSGRL